MIAVNTAPARIPRNGLENFVIREMTTAESEVLPITEYGFGGRVNKSAVRAMLARVCLFKAGYPCYDETKYSEAYKWAKMVIDDPAHSLMYSLNASEGNHQHANGLSVEFYGKGLTLGPDAGIGKSL